jgi:hypothetical protein
MEASLYMDDGPGDTVVVDSNTETVRVSGNKEEDNGKEDDDRLGNAVVDGSNMEKVSTMTI